MFFESFSTTSVLSSAAPYLKNHPILYHFFFGKNSLFIIILICFSKFQKPELRIPDPSLFLGIGIALVGVIFTYPAVKYFMKKLSKEVAKDLASILIIKAEKHSKNIVKDVATKLAEHLPHRA